MLATSYDRTSCKSRYKGSYALDDVANNICGNLASELPRRRLHRRYHKTVAARPVPPNPRATRPHSCAAETPVATHVAAQGSGGGGGGSGFPCGGGET